MFELNLEQEFNAPIDKVFAAWTDPAIIKTWFAPGEMTVPEATADPKPGGKYRIVMQDQDGEQHIVVGEFKSLTPHTQLIFSWRWETSPNTTLVKVELESVNEQQTKLRLNHSEFIEEGFRDHHLQGWQGCLANLHKIT